MLPVIDRPEKIIRPQQLGQFPGIGGPKLIDLLPPRFDEETLQSRGVKRGGGTRMRFIENVQPLGGDRIEHLAQARAHRDRRRRREVLGEQAGEGRPARRAPVLPRPGEERGVAELVVGLKAAGISDNHGLAAELMTELREHALQVAQQNRERDEVLTAGLPHYELPMVPDGIDLAGLYQLAAKLREQGAA